MLQLAGEFLFKQLLVKFGEWTSEGRMLCTNGLACCVVIGWRVFIETTPYGIRGVDLRGMDIV